MTRTVMLNCPRKAEIRAFDSQTDLRIFIAVAVMIIISKCIAALPPYIKMVPLGVYRWTYALGGVGVGNLPSLADTPNVPLCIVSSFIRLRKVLNYTI